MLEKFFSRALPRLNKSPHFADLDAFSVFISKQEYSWLGCRRHILRLSRVLNAATMTPGGHISCEDLHSFFIGWPAKGHRGTERLFRDFLLEHGRLIINNVCDPRFKLKQQYINRLRELRGLAPATLTYINWSLADFLTKTLQSNETVADLNVDKIECYFLQRRPQLARRTFHHIVGAVRNFLLYGYQCGSLLHELHHFELPRNFRFEQPPRALPFVQIEAMLESFDRSTEVGRRDYVMLHLLAWYGLRPGEVSSLTTSSVNWQTKTLTIYQSKTQSTLQLPLSDGTLQILQNYIVMRRSSNYPQLFLRGQAPYTPLSAPLISMRFKIYARRTGLPIGNASAYALRHSFAMRLLAAGVGIETIGDLLGHRNTSSTSAYLRIQSDMLRDIALDVPGREIQR